MEQDKKQTVRYRSLRGDRYAIVLERYEDGRIKGKTKYEGEWVDVEIDPIDIISIK